MNITTTLEKELIGVCMGWEEWDGALLMERVAQRGLAWLKDAGYCISLVEDNWIIASPGGEEKRYRCSLPVAVRSYCIELISGG